MVTGTGNPASGLSTSDGLITPTPRSCGINDIVDAATELLKRGTIIISTAATKDLTSVKDQEKMKKLA